MDKPDYSSFFRLLSCGLFGHEVTDVSAAEWRASLALAREQRIEGLLYAAALRTDAASRPPKDVSMALYSYVVPVKRLNEEMAHCIAELFDAYEALDAAPVLLKGHGVAANYRYPEWRTPGDVDLYIGRNFEAVDAWTRAHVTEVAEYDPIVQKHVGFSWKGVRVENHFCLSRFFHRRLNRLLLAAFAEGMAKERPLQLMLPDRPVSLLPPTVGLLHLLVHFANHLVNEGVGLRQLCDIVMYVTRRHRDIDAALLDTWISQLRLRRLTDALFTWAADHLGMPAYDSVHWRRCPSGAAVLGNLIMESGNFGQRYQTKHFDVRYYRFHKFCLLVRRSGRVVRLVPDELLAAWRGKTMNGCRWVMRKYRRTGRGAS